MCERSEQCAGNERTRIIISASDDEVGGPQGAIRARDVRAADLQEEPAKRVEKRANSPTQSFRRIRRRRRQPANIAASGAIRHSERSERSN
jgi:hypothetical protein